MSNSDTVISVENVSKFYRLGLIGGGTLRDDLARKWAKFRGKPDPFQIVGQQDTGNRDGEFIWALRDINFEVKQGEILGIIGKNGAGKSTLLKILTKITAPTKGRIKMKGRVGSLLEVGTGFHPELTGRENIYLNGAILGMTKPEISRKLDEIIAFSEVELFIDTPIKRYSSGMYVRLAFAVAAYLEPEILLIDEVLAVGDIAFQKKCLGKMEDVASHGRTVLFVSHNMQTIRTLCPRSILLTSGRMISDAPTEKSLSIYNQCLRDVKINDETSVNDETYRRGEGSIRFTSVTVQDINGNERFNFEMGETIRFKMSYRVFKEMRGLTADVALRSGITREIVTSVRHLISSEKIPAGTTGTVAIELSDVYIRPGEYPLYLHISESVHTKTNFDVLDDITSPLVIASGDNQKHSDFDPSQPIGYFSLPSSMVQNEINGN